jgi:hypothetical protein
VPIQIIGTKPEAKHGPRNAIISYTTADGIRWRRTGSDGQPVRVSEDDAFPTGGPVWYRNR